MSAENDPGDRNEESQSRRRYDSPVRRKQKTETRERIIAAGADLAREAANWDWSNLTFRAVAERAAIGERTVYRHFPTQRALHDAVMARLASDAGVDYETLTLDTVAETTRRVFSSLASFSEPEMLQLPPGPTFAAVDVQRRQALMRAVEVETPGWTHERRVMVAAAIDVLWLPYSFERLVSGWGLEPSQATEAIAWAIDALVAQTSSTEAPESDRT